MTWVPSRKLRIWAAVILTVVVVWLGGLLDRPLAPYEASARHPAVSPSGRYRLVVRTGLDQSNYQRFEIYRADQPDRKLFAAEQHFRTRDTTYFVWDQADRVWVYSGDVGTSYWTRRTDTDWQRTLAKDDQKLRPPVPIDSRLPWRRTRR